MSVEDRLRALLSGTSVALLLVLSALVALCSFYLLFLALASCFARRRRPAARTARTHFAILIPAHDEELVIGQLLASTGALAYPADRFTVHVVADHCRDRTVAIARQHACRVHEHTDPALPGKARSLNWAIARLLATTPAERQPDAFVIVDADSTVPPDLLTALDARLQAGEAIIQTRVDIEQPGQTWVSSLRRIAYACIAQLRPLGRGALGLSAGLRGNGMCFARPIAARYGWNPTALTEDYELHATLQLAGLRVAYAGEVAVRTQMPTTLTVVRSQSNRWERGRLQVMARFAPRLLLSGLRRRSWAPIDGALELLIPPFSIVVGLAAALLAVALVARQPAAGALAAIGLGAQALYVARALMLIPGRSPGLYLALLCAPFFIAWKVPLYLVAAFRRGSGQWTRTARMPGK